MLNEPLCSSTMRRLIANPSPVPHFTQVSESTQCITGYYLGTSIAVLPKVLEVLVNEPPSKPIAQPISFENSQTLKIFLQNEGDINNQVLSQIQLEPIQPAHLELASTNLTHMIASALQLGNINLLDHSTAWLDGLLASRNISPAIALQFYATYLKAVTHYLGTEGRIIIDWLARHQTPK